MWPAMIGGVVMVGSIAAWIWWRKKRVASEHRLVSIVALLREPQTLEPIYVATAARKAWNADLGDGTTEGEDGFVAGASITTAIRFRDRMFLVNCFPSPYVENPEEVASDMADIRLRTLFAQHTAWISCDALGVAADESDESVRNWYRALGPLLAELIDDNCLAIFLPDSNQLYAFSEEALERLRADDPFAALYQDAEVPVIEVAPDSKAMEKAEAEARRRWPEFVTAFEEQAGANFAVKAPITRGKNTEFIWLTVTALENDVIYGELANEPVNLPGLKLGSTVKSPVSELNDWGYLDRAGEFVGGFTIKAVEQAARKRPRKS